VGGVRRPFQRPISLSIKRTACQWGKNPEQFVDDLLQETYLKLHAEKCRLLLQFAQQHPEEAVLRYVRRLRSMSLRSLQIAPFPETRRRRDRSDVEDFDPVARSDSFGGPEAMERKVFLKQVDDQLQD